jgi:hypothetical protein
VIKAIETKYKGYRFRSRLEARWAVFFDAIDLAWEYEVEGFDLGNNQYYLPDFYLPDSKRYVEVKPTLPTFDELEKMGRLATGINKMQERSVLAYHYILCGTPGYPGFTAERICEDGIEIKPSSYIALAMTGQGGYLPQLQAFYTPNGGGKAHLESFYCSQKEILRLPAKIKAQDVTRETCQRLTALTLQGWFFQAGGKRADTYIFGPLTSIYLGDGRRAYSQTLRKAYEAARSARFEYGEKGAPV